MAKKRKAITPNTRAQRAAPQIDAARRELDARWLALVFVCLALPVAVFLHFSVDKFPDTDVFYHFRHAAIYGSAGTGGIFRTDFPWLHYSVINRVSSDLWYGFHLLIIPFTLGRDPILGMKLAGIFLTFVVLILFFTACLHLKIKAALFWPFFLLFSSAFLLHRLGMLRPQVVSLGLAALLFALLAIESVWGVFFVALACVFLHLNLFFIPFFILPVFVATKFFSEGIFAWKESLAVTAGVLVGWLLRPNPLGAAKILYVQLFEWTLEKTSGRLVNLGAELLPLVLKTNSNYLPFILLLLATLFYVFWRYSKRGLALSSRGRTNLITAAALTIIFFLLSVFFARRAFDFCSAFGVILIGLVFSHYFSEDWLVRTALICALVYLVPYSLKLRNEAMSAGLVGWNPHRFESAAQWIAANSKPGEIVFNARWEYFPELFFWNSTNVYCNGIDPVFLYDYSPALYRKGYYLVADQTDPENLTSPYKVLKEDFKARYVVLAKPFDRALYLRLSHEAKISLKHEDTTSAVFEVD